MLRVVAHKSAAAARQYYAEGLRREDYYSEGQEIVGKWHGKAAAMLGLAGDVEPQAFGALIDNEHPLTGERLTPRNRAERRVGYDINFHAPKSLSVIQALTGERRIVGAFREAVAETMAELEARVGARVRKGGARGSRTTGNFAWAEFVHFTARPVGGVPDPHLHVHAFTFNTTFDDVEGRWKAAELHDIVKEAPYAEAAFHARLAGKIAALGLPIEHGKHGWEVAGVSRQVIEKFSRRTAQIEEVAAALGIVDPKAKGALGATTRESKRNGLTKEALRKEWISRLTAEEIASLRSVIKSASGRQPSNLVTARAAVDYAIEKCFAKDSVALPNRLAGEALKFGLGSLKPDQIWQELGRREMITGMVRGELLCTTPEVLAEEVSLIDFVRSGRGRFAPIRKGPAQIANSKLSAEQRLAVEGLLNSTSQVIMIRGAAGVGKTTLMKEAAEQIEAAGLQLFSFAQSASASRGTLREEGFNAANTIAHLVTNKELQRRTRGQVIWIDEAGLVGMRELWRAVSIAGSETRIILTGDHFQHAPVARGDPFRLLQRYSGVPVIELAEIRRQEREQYRKAVTALSHGDLQTAFGLLDDIGAIVEVQDHAERYQLLVKDYFALKKRGAMPLIVSPIHAEIRIVTDAIRAARLRAGELKGEREFVSYRDLKWDDADKKRPDLYRDGLLVQFSQNAPGIVRGTMLAVIGIKDGTVSAVDAKGRSVALPLKHPDRFQVFEAESVKFAKGDFIRITRNGKSENGVRLNNGDFFKIESIGKSGEVKLSNGAKLGPDFGHWTHGYCSTSHASQSKSVKHVLVSQSKNSFVASSREQFYVSVSRGKQSVRIYTDDRAGLQQAVGNSSTRLSGVELTRLNSKDIARMAKALSSTEWREYVRARGSQPGPVKWQDRFKSRMSEEKTGQHRKNLIGERRGSQPKQGNVISWQEYVKMRRDNAGTDGKNRSRGRGSPHVPNSKAPEQRLKELRQGKKAATAVRKQAVPAKRATSKSADARTQREVAKVKSAAAHFKRTSAGKKTAMSTTRVRPKKGLAPSSAKQAAIRKMKNRKTEARKQQGESMKRAKQKTQQVVKPGPRK